MSLLRDYERKRSRAMHHADVLRESIERAIDRDREAVRGVFDPDTGQYIFKVPFEPLDPAWALLLGDFVYNTRASLDYLITALVRSTGQEEDHRNEFPINGIDRIRWQDVDEWWEKDPKGRIVRQLNGTPSGTKAALKPLQPFYGAPRTNPGQHPLFWLQILSNRDKHRRLNLLIHRATINFVDACGEPIFQGPAPDTRIAEPTEGDTYTVTFAPRKKRDVDMYLLPTYDVRLDEPPQLVGSVIDTLAGINQFIDARILPTIRRLLGP
jgi:hypothetical protein